MRDGVNFLVQRILFKVCSDCLRFNLTMRNFADFITTRVFSVYYLNKFFLLLIFILGMCSAYGQEQALPQTTPSKPAAAVEEFNNLIPSVTQTQQVTTILPNAPQILPMPPKQTPSVPRRKPPPLTYEQQQEVMLESIPPNSPKPDTNHIIAFTEMLNRNVPLTPDQIVMLRQQIDMSQRAAAIPANIPPKPVSSTIMINLAPGTTPPAIRLAQGYVSSLVFVDSTGAPWPIAAFDIGNPTAVNLQWDGKSNIIFMQARQAYSDGNMVVRLVGLPTPITLELVAGQRVVDYRADIHVSGIGPNAKELPIGTPLPESANQLLLGILDGVAPAGSRQLIVHGADAQAWLLAERIYFRTRLTVLSPGWVGKMVSPDGMHAYELPPTSSILVSRYGEPVELKIEGL